MSLSDSLNNPESLPQRAGKHPKGYEPGVRYEPREVTVKLPRKPGSDEAAWRLEISRHTNLTIPMESTVTLTDVRYWGNPDQPNIYAKYKIDDAPSAELDLSAMVKDASKLSRRKAAERTGDRTLVVSWADLQVGKTGSRGGTEELIARVMEKLASVEEESRRLGCKDVYLIDVGDCVESFENTSEQGFTNDLSFPEQLRVARRLFTEAVVRLSNLHDQVVCIGIPSNHGRWRRGKGVLGRPGDDFGLETLTAVADALALNSERFSHVSFLVPPVWEETLAVEIQGQVLGIAHGHQVGRPDGVPTWWANQTHGAQPVAQADVLLTGHFHSFRMQCSGRSTTSGRSKWWIQAPTLDNGSDWYRHRAGSDSDPGMLTFTMSATGVGDIKIH